MASARSSSNGSAESLEIPYDRVMALADLPQDAAMRKAPEVPGLSGIEQGVRHHPASRYPRGSAR